MCKELKRIRFQIADILISNRVTNDNTIDQLPRIFDEGRSRSQRVVSCFGWILQVTLDMKKVKFNVLEGTESQLCWS
jgi:hypothetical protein